MGKNTGYGSRKGAVKQRTQCYNSLTDQYVKRDTSTGRFISSKKGAPFKGVTKETNRSVNKQKTNKSNKSTKSNKSNKFKK